MPEHKISPFVQNRLWLVVLLLSICSISQCRQMSHCYTTESTQSHLLNVVLRTEWLGSLRPKRPRSPSNDPQTFTSWSCLLLCSDLDPLHEDTSCKLPLPLHKELPAYPNLSSRAIIELSNCCWQLCKQHSPCGHFFYVCVFFKTVKSKNACLDLHPTVKACAAVWLNQVFKLSCNKEHGEPEFEAAAKAAFLY